MTGTRYPQVYTRVMPYPRVKIPVDPGKPFRRNDGYPLPAIYTRVMPYPEVLPICNNAPYFSIYMRIRVYIYGSIDPLLLYEKIYLRLYAMKTHMSLYI